MSYQRSILNHIEVFWPKTLILAFHLSNFLRFRKIFSQNLLTNVNFETLSTLHKTQLTLNLNHHIIDSKEIFSFCFLRPRSPRRSFVWQNEGNRKQLSAPFQNFTELFLPIQMNLDWYVSLLKWLLYIKYNVKRHLMAENCTSC